MYNIQGCCEDSWDYFNESVSQSAVQLEEIIIRGVDKYGVAHVILLGRYLESSTLEQSKN